MNINDYKDPIVSQWNKYARIVENEPHVVTSGMFALTGLPDIQQRVVINGYVEIGDKDKIESSDEFKIDYTNGYVFMHSSKEGETINVAKYASRGVNYYPASRVYTGVNSFGEVTETLDDFLDKVDQVYDAATNLDESIAKGKQTKQELDTSISTSVTRKGQLDASIDTSITKKDELDASINSSITRKNQLDESIVDSVVKKGELDNSISLSTNKKQEIDSSIQLSIVKKTELDSSIDISTTKKNQLDDSIGNSVAKKQELDNSIQLSVTRKEQLDTSIGDSVVKKSELDTSIDSAENIIWQLDDKFEDIEMYNPFIEKFIANTNQKDFILTKGGYKDYPMTQVYIQGVCLVPIEDFTLSDEHKVTISEPLPQGAEVVVHVLQTLPIEGDKGNIVP